MFNVKNCIIISSLLIITALLSHPTYCLAGTLGIKSEPKIEGSIRDSEVIISGSYIAQNIGNEKAREVLPILSIGGWKWAGEPVELAPNESYTWKINDTFPIEQLSCKHDSSCASLDLPIRGKFPIFIHKLYQDMNGYQFSSSEVLSITIGEVTSEENFRLRAPAVTHKVIIKPDGENFLSEMLIQNIGAQPVSIAPKFFTTREFNIVTQPNSGNIEPSKQFITQSKIENFKGIKGSAYPIFGVVQWNDSGVRNTIIAQEIATIKAIKKQGPLGLKISNQSFYIYACITSMIGMLILLQIFVIGPRKKA